ncbi:MAG: N-acetyltransferase [Pseudomonadota bacterium]
MLEIIGERPEDADAVEFLYDLAFAPGRHALSSYRLREGVAPVAALCCLACDGDTGVAGAIRYWPVEIGQARSPALLLGPIAVHPTRQGEGLGALLMAETLDRAAELGWSRVLLVGDEVYYGRFGFSRESAANVVFPPPTNPERLLGRPLVTGAFEGVSGRVAKWTGAAT